MISNPFWTFLYSDSRQAGQKAFDGCQQIRSLSLVDPRITVGATTPHRTPLTAHTTPANQPAKLPKEANNTPGEDANRKTCA